MIPRYPIYIPSRDRWQPRRRLTINALTRDEVPFRVVVEPQEAERYTEVVGHDRVVVLPESDRGLTFARNWIRDHAEASGFPKHWQLDDNVREFRALVKGRRIPCDAGVALKVCEDFTDRYSNVGISGPNYQMFVTADTPVPYREGVHVYSVVLVNHEMPHRWRLQLNEDADLCLQALADGWATLSINAFMANKMQTMKIPGGNTERYAGDGRLEMARMLAAAWPGIVEVKCRYGRPQHVVRWNAFDVPLIQGPPSPVETYDLRLKAVREVESPALRQLLEEEHLPQPATRQ
jgi:hypothetical protein